MGSTRPWTGAKKIKSQEAGLLNIPDTGENLVKRNWIQQKGVLLRALLGEGEGREAETDQGGVKK